MELNKRRHGKQRELAVSKFTHVDIAEKLRDRSQFRSFSSCKCSESDTFEAVAFDCVCWRNYAYIFMRFYRNRHLCARCAHHTHWNVDKLAMQTGSMYIIWIECADMNLNILSRWIGCDCDGRDKNAFDAGSTHGTVNWLLVAVLYRD